MGAQWEQPRAGFRSIICSQKAKLCGLQVWPHTGEDQNLGAPPITNGKENLPAVDLPDHDPEVGGLELLPEPG